jgi:hypothetical protein
MKYFTLISHSAPEGCLPHRCVNTIEVEAKCVSTKSRDNWRAATGACAIANPVDTALFTTDLVTTTMLDTGALTSEMRHVFADHNVDLSPAAVLRIEERGRIWYVADGNKMYTFLRQPDKIYVFDASPYLEVSG